MKVGIFTPYSLNPIHPRTEMYLSFFDRTGIEAILEQGEGRHGFFSTLLSKTFINMFDFSAVVCLSKKIKHYDCILIQDLKYLPLAIPAKWKGRKVIYESLDNSVFIRVHNQRKNVYYGLIRFLTPVFCGIEKMLCRIFTKVVVVNSAALKKYFNNKALLVFYSSPFESSGIRNNPLCEPAILYLGAVSHDKGIDEILNLSDRYKLRVFIYGDCQELKIREELESKPQITWAKRMNSSMLKKELEMLTRKYYLIGTSMIRPVHVSYATQEANKEIDYMSMGIPFIGNHRLTTSEKIEAGCGVFVEDTDSINTLLNDEADRNLKTANSLQYYEKNYSIREFYSKLKPVFEL